MLINSNNIKGTAVGSVRSSGRIGRIIKPIINPHNLHVDALFCRIISIDAEQLIMPDDIRDFSPHGVIIDDHDKLIEPEDAVRLRPILKLNFDLIGLAAYVGRRKVGVVKDYAVENGGLFIEKIYVQPNLLNRLGTSQLVFSRPQVEEITRNKITFTDSSRIKSTVAKVVKESGAQPSLSTSFTRE